MKIFLFFLFTFFDTIMSTNVISLGDDNLDVEIKNNVDSSLVLLFVTKDCIYCKETNIIFEKTSEKAEKKFKFSIVDCSFNMYTCVRFNITKLPSIIILEKGFFFEVSNYLTDYSLLSFINEERFESNGRTIPHSHGFIDILFKSLNVSIIRLNKFLEYNLLNFFSAFSDVFSKIMFVSLQ